MEIIQTTTITLSEEEKKAIQTIIGAYETCVGLDCFECNKCPLYVSEHKDCIGRICDHLREGVNYDN